MTAGISLATAIFIVPFVPHVITAMEKISNKS
jgi:hypothetical protein